MDRRLLCEAGSGMSLYRLERALPYSRELLFDLVADVERYPSFLPYWVAARVTARMTDAYRTDQVLRLGFLRQRFSTQTLLQRPEHIQVTSDDPRFRRFRLSWSFLREDASAARVALEAEIELRSRMSQRLFEPSLAGSLATILSAFEDRARMLHGEASRR